MGERKAVRERMDPPWVWPLATLCLIVWILMVVFAAYESGYYDGLAQPRPLPHDKEVEGE